MSPAGTCKVTINLHLKKQKRKQKMKTKGITNLTYHQGQTMRFFKAVYHSKTGKQINLFYDCDTKQLVIHKWYDLPPAEIDQLKADALKAIIAETANQIILERSD